MKKVFTLRPVEALSYNDFEHLAFVDWQTIPQELEARYNHTKVKFIDDDFDYIISVKWSDKTITDYYIEERKLV